MINLSKSYLVGLATKLLVILLLSKILSLSLLWFLPSDSVELNVKENYKPNYQRVDFKNMINDAKVAGKSSRSKGNTSITSMLLKGIYGTKVKGFAIIAPNSSPNNTTIIAIGEEYQCYILKHIIANGVVFTKNSLEYTLKLEEFNAKDNFIRTVKDYPTTGNVKNIARQDINNYVKNPTKIWKEISIEPLTQGRKIKGFKVTRIVKGSGMAAMGLQKNDVIIRANNIELNSLKSVTDFYGNIRNIKAVELVVLRNNQEKELVYEIN